MENRKLVVSTNNIHKLEEIKRILADLPIEVLSKKEIGLEDFDIIEDGNTLEENSIKKAKALSEKTEYMVMADDSGLFVDALKGEPGVYSSRYAGEEGNDKKNNEKLLENMKDIDRGNRTASFKAVIAIVTEKKEIITSKGKCKGHIEFKLKGSNDFGYDPLFIPEGYNQSFAELDQKIKNKISHRAKALEGIRDILIDLLRE